MRIYAVCRMAPDRARLNIVLDKATEEKFKQAVFNKYGMKKGNLQIAAEEALHDWIEKQMKKEGKKQ